MAANVFNSVAVKAPSQNTFNLSHDFKFSCDMGELIPVLVSDVLPGDVWRLNSQPLVRFAPMLAPIMHQVNVSLHCFFVPNRLVWPNFDDFISPPKADSIAPSWPHRAAATTFDKGSLGDYFGLPTGVSLSEANGTQFSVIPFAGYTLIWNEYYRDQNLQDEAPYLLSNGPSTGTVYSSIVSLRNRSWMHDYFTGSLPFAQKGQAVQIPIGLTDMAVKARTTTGSTGSWSGSAPAGVVYNIDNYQGGTAPMNKLYADGSSAQFSGTINDLRVAMRTQEFLERQARGGSRYIEQIRMQFGVKSSDARLQRPEYIGGLSNPVIISEVLQTSPPTGEGVASTPQGTMAGHGYSASRGYQMRYYSEEHGYIFMIMSITPKTAYQQGIPKHFLRQSMYDYAWPVLAHIGEQPVQNKEIYVAADGQNNNTFGYVPRYSEYRYIPSHVGGDFRDNLRFWHLGRYFANRPLLNADFIQVKKEETKRIFAVQDPNIDSLWCHVFHSAKVTRKLPKYGTPTL